MVSTWRKLRKIVVALSDSWNYAPAEHDKYHSAEHQEESIEAMNNRYPSQLDRSQAAQARALLAVLGWSHNDLARKTGLKRATVTNILTLQYPAWQGKAAINRALGRNIFTKTGAEVVQGKSSRRTSKSKHTSP